MLNVYLSSIPLPQLRVQQNYQLSICGRFAAHQSHDLARFFKAETRIARMELRRIAVSEVAEEV